MERKTERKKERKTPEANEKMKNELPQVGFEPTCTCTHVGSNHKLNLQCRPSTFQLHCTCTITFCVITYYLFKWCKTTFYH